MAEDPFKAMNLSRREYLSKYGQSVIDSPNSNISDREDALVVKEGLANQRGREAQQQFYDVAPSAREAFLEDNAVISASPQFGQVQGYMGEVRRGPTYADNVLRKSIASNLPAAYRGRFDELVDSGIGVNEARTQVELEKGDEDLGLSLIDAGIHPDEVEKLRNPETGIIDQKQARWMKSQKSRETTSRGESPAIKAMKDSYEILRQTAKDIEGEYGRPDAGTNPEYDDTVARMASLRQRILAANDSVFNPPSGATVDTTTDYAAADAAEVGLQGAAAPVVAAPPAVRDIDFSKVPYADIEKQAAEAEKQSKEFEEIGKVWFDAQKDLQAKLEKAVGTGNIGKTNYSKLRRFAEAVVADETTPTGELGAGGDYRMDVPVGHTVLKKLGLSPTDAAFSEPGNKRLGTQKVTYEQLLKVWAKNYLGTAPVTMVPQVPALSAEKAQEVDSLLDSLTK